ncbi:hypothetical protein BD408DRAFT_413201 [Parasitella parasitica]|nr:hypothetical protein BD408DRAFT_413201 [Parasitella parasitica]
MNYSRDYYNPSYTQRYSRHQKLPQSIENRCQPLFEAMKRLSLTCNGLSRTLESTLVATHSGFKAFSQLTHQYRTIKHFVSQMSSIVSFLSWLRNKLVCSQKSTLLTKFSIEEFESYNKTNSKIPWTIFLALSISASMVMYSHKKKRQLQSKIEEKKACASSESKTAPKIMKNAAKIEFARAKYSFHAKSSDELILHPNDLIAILSREDNEWWQGRLRNGEVGYFPANHVEIIEKR